MSRKKKVYDTCVYCGDRPGVTDDHVIPRSYFNVVPQNVITVPSCRACNERKEVVEQYCRDYLAVNISTHNHPDINAYFQGPMQRAIAKNRSALVRSARGKVFATPFRTPAGLDLGRAYAISIDQEKVSALLTMMARGFLYHRFQQRIPQEYVARFTPIDLFSATKTLEEFATIQTCQPLSWGKHVCGYMLEQSPIDPATTTWVIWFYTSQLFLVTTFNPDDDPFVAQ